MLKSERVGGVGDLSLVTHSAELPGEFIALGEAGGSERMAFADESTGGVDHVFTPVGELLLIYK